MNILVIIMTYMSRDDVRSICTWTFKIDIAKIYKLLWKYQFFRLARHELELHG
jgi:hypothetical protein